MTTYSPDEHAKILEGTSAIQSTSAAEAVVTKARAAHGTSADMPRDIGSTNVRSIYWGMHTLRANGTISWVFGFPAPVQVFSDSQIAVSMTELDNNDQPFMGLAQMQVYNVVPHADSTVTVTFKVDWGSQIRVRFNFIIVN
jgi:hypothetical protein